MCATSPTHRLPPGSPCSASAKTWPRSSTTNPACSPSSATSAANGLLPLLRDMVQAPVEAHVIDKGQYRACWPGAGGQVPGPPAAVPPGGIFAASRTPLRRSTLAQWVGECGVQMQCRWSMPGRGAALRQRGAARRRDAGGDVQARPRQDHRAYLWRLLQRRRVACGRWCSTSPRRAAGSMCATSWACLEQPVANPAGKGICWSPTTSASYKGRCSTGVTEEPAAWRMHGASSSICGPIHQARWASRR